MLADGAVIGSRAFVNKAFAKSRERFGSKRRDGAAEAAWQRSASGGRLVERAGSQVEAVRPIGVGCNHWRLLVTCRLSSSFSKSASGLVSRQS